MSFANFFVKLKLAPKKIKKVGDSATLLVWVGNDGATPLVKKSVELTVSIGYNCDLKSLSKGKGSDWQGWKVKRKEGDTIQLISDRVFNPSDSSTLKLNLKATKSGTQTAGANVAWVIGKNEELGNQAAIQGNTNWEDDNDKCPITVGK